MLSALQQARSDRDLGQLLLGWQGLFRELRQAPDGARALWLVLRYVYAVRGAEEFASIRTVAREINQESEDLMQTMADYLESKGMARGRRELLLRLLQRRFGPLSTRVHEQVMASDDAEIDRWSDRILEADSLNAIFAP